HKIVQAESVVAGDEVDAGDRLASVPAIQVAGAEKPRREVGGDPAVALPEPSDRVAVLAVPFAPHVGKVADLVAARPDVPWLGDQLDLRENRILVDDVEECRKLVDIVQFA